MDMSVFEITSFKGLNNKYLTNKDSINYISTEIRIVEIHLLKNSFIQIFPFAKRRISLYKHRNATEADGMVFYSPSLFCETSKFFQKRQAAKQKWRSYFHCSYMQACLKNVYKMNQKCGLL